MNLPTYADVAAAAPVVHRYLPPTPLYEYPALSALLGCHFYLKHENHTPTTAFKVRGGVYLVSRLSEEQRRRGILGCTTGNHGQSLAYAARLFGARCVLVVPANANPDKLAVMRALGAEINGGEPFHAGGSVVVPSRTRRLRFSRSTIAS